MHFSTLVTLVALAASAVARPAETTLTGQYDCAPAGAYTLCQNLWGKNAGVGNQNLTLISTSGNSNTQKNVKSYANVPHNSAKGIQVYRVDVSYDIWTGVQPSGDPATSASSYEIMIWLAGTIHPVGSQVQMGISLAGHHWSLWNLWKGLNANWEVLSFVSQDGDINNFSVDLKVFFDYLVQNQGVAGMQYIQAIQAGTEPFTGSTDLLTSTYSVAVNQ
ncbi:concanavalin A-like lectin/glucanase domain-containing protein [Fomes fomentarius]|nr:concanavalin A-like lectin/glucanase domain-containing protein [Fomes fomentarius]